MISDTVPAFYNAAQFFQSSYIIFYRIDLFLSRCDNPVVIGDKSTHFSLSLWGKRTAGDKLMEQWDQVDIWWQLRQWGCLEEWRTTQSQPNSQFICLRTSRFIWLHNNILNNSVLLHEQYTVWPNHTCSVTVCFLALRLVTQFVCLPVLPSTLTIYTKNQWQVYKTGVKTWYLCNICFSIHKKVCMIT